MGISSFDFAGPPWLPRLASAAMRLGWLGFPRHPPLPMLLAPTLRALAPGHLWPTRFREIETASGNPNRPETVFLELLGGWGLVVETPVPRPPTRGLEDEPPATPSEPNPRRP